MRRDQRGDINPAAGLIVLSLGLVLMGVLVTVGISTAYRAFAQTTGGYLGGGELGVGTSVPGGSASGPSSGTASPSGGGGGGGGPTPTCTATGPDDTPVTGPVSYTPASDDLAHSLDSDKSSNSNILAPKPNPGAQGSWYVKRCGGAPAGYVWSAAGSPPGPPPPPPPPTAAEVYDRVPLPTPTFGVSPRGNGLTGLATYLWDPVGAGPRSVSTTIRGWTATATANPGTWSWTMYNSGEPGPPSRSNPPPNVSAHSPGSEASPAATFTYQTAGTYTITVTVTWSGSFTYTRPGFSSVTAPLGTTTRQATRSYTVAAITPVVLAST